MKQVTERQAHYAARFGYTLTQTPEGYATEHWSGKNYATFTTTEKALRCIEKAERMSETRAREIMSEVGAIDLHALRAAGTAATTTRDRLRLAEAYTVLSAAHTPEARAAFANLADLIRDYNPDTDRIIEP